LVNCWCVKDVPFKACPFILTDCIYLFIAEAFLDGKFRFQFGREDIPVTKRLRFNMMINTDKERMAGLRYIATKYFSVSSHYDSDMAFGAGITVTY
jgi:hypothetical protein